MVAEAGTAAPAYVLGEASTSPAPLVTVDGVPWGTGHALADDPWLTPQQGLRWEPEAAFSDGLGGTGGRLTLATDDPDPPRSVSTYRGVKGRHESYMRGIDLLTADAPWRVGFAFEEVIDNEAWNYTTGPDELFRPDDSFYPGHGKVRQSRTRLQRVLDPGNRLTLEFSTARLTRNDVPSWHADQREIWDTGVAATMDGTSDGLQLAGGRPLARPGRAVGRLRPRPHGTDRRAQGRDRTRRPPPGAGAPRGRAAAAAPLTSLRLAYHQWSVDDRSDTVQVRPADLGPTSGRGRQVRLEAGGGHRFAGSWRRWGCPAPGTSASTSPRAGRRPSARMRRVPCGAWKSAATAAPPAVTSC